MEKDNVVKFLSVLWIMNLMWLMLLLWGVESCIQEKGMEWMENPQFYCIWACSVTKFVLSLILLDRTKLVKFA